MFQSPCTDTRAKHNNKVRHGNHITGKTNSQCMLQNLWLYEHGSGSLLPERFQAWALHEDPSKINAFSSGILNLM